MARVPPSNGLGKMPAEGIRSKVLHVTLAASLLDGYRAHAMLVSPPDGIGKSICIFRWHERTAIA